MLKLKGIFHKYYHCKGEILYRIQTRDLWLIKGKNFTTALKEFFAAKTKEKFMINTRESFMANTKVIMFDLFFTLINPIYLDGVNENDVLHMDRVLWESFAENDTLYNRRASGLVLNEREIIKEIIELIPMEVSENQIDEILRLRKLRIRNAMTNIDPSVLKTLRKLAQVGFQLCMISNSDIIDAMYWQDSELSACFNETVFSCEAGSLKPDPKIYEIALNRMDALPEQCFYVGDGGFDELKTAKKLGMTTILTEYMDKKNPKLRNEIMKSADYCIDEFSNILDIIG